MQLTLLCSLSGHRAEAAIIENAGHSFSRCGRCRSDLVRVEGRWTAAPKGFRIVWRSAGETAPVKAADAPQQIEAAPVPVEIAQTPQPAAAEAVQTSDVLELATELAQAGDPLDFDMTVAQAPEPLDFEATPAEEAAEPAPIPQAIFPERRRVDRRAPEGTRPPYTGFERRQADRRSFGRKRGER